ncbi:MAG TPA: hypothetical protein PL110_02395 [Candidatus Eremiobacteraeota bacterium]|nr:MAG: hypothetical protein BWY64_00704 [bacterium ADurb.Bin363]HPZ06937.1 hypothetical protein [Candidatus Eremiobacteraeota bacterium]
MSEKYTDIAEFKQIGLSLSGEPVYCFKAGKGPLKALLISKPQDPVGTFILNYLYSELLSNKKLIEDEGYTWYIIQNCSSNTDHNFPLNYKNIKYKDDPDIRALMNIIDQTRIDLIITLQNTNSKGLNYYITDSCPELCTELYKLVRKYNLPLEKSMLPFLQTLYKKTFYKCYSSRNLYDYYEDFPFTGKKHTITGECIEIYTKLRWDSFGMRIVYPRLILKELMAAITGSILYGADYVREIYRKNLQNLENLKIENLPSKVTLCHFKGRSCVGCCMDCKEDKNLLKHYVEENTKTFKEYFGKRTLISYAEIEDYIFKREGQDRTYSKDFFRNNCSLAGYVDEDKTIIGCLIHPERLKGTEIRESLWMLICDPHEKCYRDLLWEDLPEEAMEEYKLKTKGMDWVDYSRHVYTLIPELYVKYKLKNDIRNHPYFKRLTSLYLNTACKIKENLHLMDEFYTLEEIIEYSGELLEQNFNKFGQLFLEKCLKDIEKKYKINLLLMEMPEESLKKGHLLINGHINYMVFLPAQRKKTEKTILISTSYDNPETHFGNNYPETAKTLAFMIKLLEELINIKDKSVNYIFTFLGADNDDIAPLMGSFYFMEKLKEGLLTDSETIFHKDIICHLYLRELLKGKYYGKIICHTPVFLEKGTPLEEYIEEKLYNDVDNPDKTVLSSITIGNYLVNHIGQGKILELTGNKSKTKAIISGIKELSNFKEKEIENLMLNIAGDTPLKGILTDHTKEKIRFFEVPESTEDLKNSLVKKGILTKDAEEIKPFHINTSDEFTSQLSLILTEAGFDIEEERVGRKIGIYPGVRLKIPTVCIEGLEGKEKTEIKEVLFREKIVEFLKWLEERDT